MERTLTGTTTPDQNGPGSNGTIGVLHILQSSRIGASPSDEIKSYLGYSLIENVLLLCRDALGVIYSPSRLGSNTRVSQKFYNILVISKSVTTCSQT